MPFQPKLSEVRMQVKALSLQVRGLAFQNQIREIIESLKDLEIWDRMEGAPSSRNWVIRQEIAKIQNLTAEILAEIDILEARPDTEGRAA